MFIVLLTIQILVCIAMIGVILLQRSEGGGLGLGTGGGVGGLMTGRGAANALTRTTVILATIFIVTSIALALVAKSTRQASPLAPPSQNVPLTPLGVLPGSSTPSSQPAPAQPSSTNPSTIPVPTTLPASPAPAQPSGAQPAPSQPTPAAPSGSGN